VFSNSLFDRVGKSSLLNDLPAHQLDAPIQSKGMPISRGTSVEQMFRQQNKVSFRGESLFGRPMLEPGMQFENSIFANKPAYLESRSINPEY